jgi:hypothetical protein
MSTVAQIKEIVQRVLPVHAPMNWHEKRTLCGANAPWMGRIVCKGWYSAICTRPMPPPKNWRRS